MNTNNGYLILLNKLQDRKITLKELLIQIDGIEKANIDEDIKKYCVNKKIRKDITIENISKLNYIETILFIDKQLKKGLTKELLENEIYNIWDEGKITGFDYRYFVEALGEDVKEEFIIKSKKIGRYYF